ncbi:retention module-containing protein [Vibrio algivorus]|uniref:retention module-containing protein n=3 Tax=Vibrio algivorus TaxID=1667024 RepID=UPI0023308CFE|nr:retention module-containing protein [Vibrio algivorus]
MENQIPSSNVTNVNVENGSVFVIKAGQGAVLVTGNYQLKPDEVLLVTPGANATVSGQGQQVHIHDSQSTVSIVPNATGPVVTTLGPQVQINAENAQNANFTESDIANIQRSVMNQQDPSQDIMNLGNSDEQDSKSNQTDDIAAIQQSILAGQDPTQEAEAPAAGQAAGNTANNSFISVDYNYDAVLTKAGYDTEGFEREYRDEEDERAVLIAEGGINLDVEVTEGDLDSGVGYPTESTASVVVEKGTYALDPDSFYIPQESVDSLLSELNAEITSGGEPVEFSYDAETNTFTGMQDGEIVVSFDVDFIALPNGDLTVSITTIVNQPIDHISGDTTGMVSNQGDDIHIEFPVSGTDINGNEIKEPIDVNDGVNEEFGTDPGTVINESDDLDSIIHGQVPLDLGSDEIATIVFDPNQPSLEGLTSNGEPTEYTVDGNVLTVSDINGEPVLTVEVQTDGSYTVQVTGPLDQDADDITNLDLGITATDDDGDTANGTIVIKIEDGENAANVSDEVTINEGDLENPNVGNAYPVHGSSSVTIVSPDDNIDPSSLRLSEAGKAALQNEMSEVTINDGDPVTFNMTTDENGVITITGVDGDGNPVLDITMTPTMNENGDVTVVTDVNQYQPLDENNGAGDTTGLITNNGDTISVDLPLEIDDTDGDTSTIDITVNFKDGEDPSFGENTEIAEITENDGEQTANGSIEFDQGSDHVDEIVFDPNQPSLEGITSNGEATHIDTAALASDPSTLTLLDADNNPVMSVTIDADGHYTVTQYQPIDQDDSDITNIALNVSGTDDDGDTANGTINIVIHDGANAENVTDTIDVIEGDVDTGAVDGDGNPVQTYPVEGHGSVTIESPSDNLVAGSLRLSEAGKAALQNEMSEVTINDGDPVTFNMTTDENGVITITGVDGDGNPVLDITMTPTMNENGDVTVVTDVNQYQPLDENNGAGDTTGLITNNGDTISVDLPLEIDDTDGDTSTIDITVNFKDGEDPSFGENTEIAEITENDGEQTANGSIEFDQGSDHVDEIVFDPNQPSLEGITSNGEATHIDTAALASDPSTLTLLDADNNPVMSVTIDADGHYTVTQYQPIDQDDSDITNIELNVSGTDDDGDTANGTIDIVIHDGANAENVTDTIDVIEGDVDTGAVDADGNPVQTYPVEGHGSVTIESPSDNLVAGSLRLSEAGKAALQNEMSEVTINGGDPVVFNMTTDDNGVITITGVDGEGNPVLDITMTPTMNENGDVTVVTDVNQYQPLDDNDGTGDTTGLITNNGDTISVDLPLEIDDTDGDTSSVDITVNFKDGEDPSFGDNTEIAEITENDGEQTANGSIEFDQGSDYVDEIVFDAEQPSLSGITSNGEATSVVVDGSTLTLNDVNGDPVMEVTIDAQGNYTVTQYQPIDQDDSDITNIALNVSGTDDDGDTANGTINIVINDGDNAADVSDTVDVIEGDVDTGAVDADGNPVQTYPVEGHGSITIESPSDNLVAGSLRLSEAGKAALQNEISEVTINDGDPVTFNMTTDENGVITITGVDGEGNPVLDITMTPIMNENGDVTVVTDVNQYQPLDENDGVGDTTGLITNNGDTISVDLPLEIDDTDGDTSTIDITVNFKDGEDPSFGENTEIAEITENDGEQTANGSIEFDQGSDHVDEIVFDPNQPSLEGITSNGEAIHIDTAALASDPSTLTLLDADNNPVMSVTIDADGHYTVTQYQPIDQDDSDITNIELNVSGTDDDGDTANGTIDIVIHDGANAENVTDTIDVIEGDVDTGAVDGDGNPIQTYPVEGHGSVTIESPSDNLVAGSLRLSEAGKAALQNEMSEVTINGGDPVVFNMTTDENGVITITGVDGEGNPVLDITMTPTMNENGDVTVVTDVNQYQPLDDNDGTGDTTGLITNNGDTISVDLPLEIDDTDGDTSSVDITVNFKDGEDPSFGDNTEIAEITENDGEQTANGSIEFDQGSDHVDEIVFDPNQPSLEGITSNGEATHIDTAALASDPSTLTLLDADNNPVMSVTIDADGHYTVTQYQPIDQDDSDITNIALNVSGTDDDGDTANGTINIVINDGANAEDVSDEVTIEEGDLENPASGNEYPVHGESSKLIPTPNDDLDPSTLQLTDEAKVILFGDGTEANPGELSEITSGGQPVDFELQENPDGSMSIVGTVDGENAITIGFEVVQGEDGEFYINTTVDQALPLDDINKDGDTSGLITNDGDVISIDLPLEISDTDGDTSNIDITVNLEDGQDPSFSDDSEAVVINETDFDNIDPDTGEGNQTPGQSTGKIPSFDMGSDEIVSMTFDDPQGENSGLDDITYDGGKETDYEVDGNTITVTGENDEPILSISVDTEGNYTITQYEPIDQDAGDVDLNLSVTAVDDDGDSASGSFNIVIVDPEGTDATDEINITEGDKENWADGNAYPVSGSSSVVIDSTSDNLRPDTLHIDPEVSTALEAELDGLTSNGQPIDFEIITNIDGTITITGTAGGSDILTMTMTPTVDANGNATITTDVIQNGPVDHEDGNGDSEGYVTNNGDTISIDVPLVIDDADGTSNNVDITVNIADGQDPSFGTDTGVTLEEGSDGIDSGKGHIDVDTGSDEVVDVRFASDQSQLDGITSNGQTTSVELSDDGHTLTIVDEDGNPVMEVTIDQNGDYEVNQSQPIDQISEDGDISDIPINVEVEDADGDVGKGTITIHDTDGVNAQGGGEIDAGMVEEDLTPGSESEGYPKTAQSGSTHVDAGSDDLDPSTVQVDPNVMDDLITELNAEITTKGGGSVKFSFNPETNTLTGVDASGNPVLDFHLIATPTENGGVDISVDMTQYQPIDHVDGAGDTTGYVHNDGDNITINVPIQIQDTDGDFMDESIDFNGTISDGNDLEIDSADSISVNESDIDKGGDNHEGSTPGQNGESATGTITIDSGSDYVDHYEIDVDAFNEKNSDSEGNSNITSGGTDVILVDNGDGTYSGVLVDENGNPTDDDVFNISFDNTNGSYTFEVTGAIDQPLDNGNGGQSTNIIIPIHGVDDDGDSSNTIDVNVTVNDDVPTATDINEAVEEGVGLTYLGDVLTQAGEGADGAQVTAIVVDGEEIALDTLPTETGPDGNEYYVYEVQDSDDNHQDLGILYVSESGDVYFDPSADLDHDGSDLKENIQFIVTDGDGDTDTADVNIVVTDEGPTMEVSGGTGQEEDGRHTTDVTDNVDDNTREGIEINMTVNVGDIDEHEALGEVTITPQGEAHGVFEFNGEPITPNEDGSITIPNAAFTPIDNGDGTLSYELNGITFVPDEDFSTVDGDLGFNVSVEVTDDDHREEIANGSFNITVEGIADTPTWDMDNTDLYYETSEDSDNVKLNIDVDLNDNDGSETLEYHLQITEGEGDIYVDGEKIEPDENGVYTISADDIDKVEVDPADNWSGEMKIDAWGTSTESGDTVDGKETADSSHQTIIIDVTPDADEVSMSTNNNIKVDEDTAIHLSDVITKVNTSVDDDGSESYFVRISGLPEGATVWGVDDEGNPVELEPNADGFYVISFDDIDDTVIMPPPQSNEDFTFTVDGMSVDNADLSDTDLNDEDIWAGQDSSEINVDMHGVVDDPTIVTSGDWEVSDDGKTISTTVDEDGAATIDFSFISGEYTNSDGHGAVSEDTDTSEKVTFTTLQDIPEGVYFSDADGNPLEPTLVSTNPDLYQFDVNSLNGIQIHTNSNSADDIDIPVRVVVTEDDGDSQEYEYNIHINVNPVVDGVGKDENGNLEDYNTTSKGNEDELIKLNWDPTAQFVDNDGSEQVVGLTVNGFENYPDGYALVIGDEVLTPDENGSIILTPEQLEEAQESGLYLSMPEDADSDLHLTTDITIRDSDTENPDDNYDETTIHGNLDVDVTAVVEEDGDGVDDGGKLVIDDADGNAIADTDGDGIQDIYEDPNDEGSNEIRLSVNDIVNGSSGGNSLDWVNDDTSSDEVINKVIITFPDDLPDGFQVEGAINNGNGSFTITEDKLDDIVIKAPIGFDGDVTIHVSVTIQDQGDDANSESETVIKETDITLHFTNENDGGDGTYTPPAAGDIDDATQDQQVDASEDQEGGVNIGDLISDGFVISTDDTDGDGVPDLDNDTTSIIINADDLPEGATIDGMEYNEQTGEYVISVTPNADGSITLPPDVILNLPPDYAGDIDIPVKVVETDNDSGLSNEGSMNITVNVNPVADAPEVTITGGGDEDSLIELDLSTVIGDQNNGGINNGGDEEITDVTIKLVDPSQGEFVDENGDVIQPDANGEIHVDPNESIYFQPAPDFSGTVDVTVTTDVTDTAMVDGEEVSNSGSFEQNVSFDVNAVNDDIEINGEVATGENPVQVTGDEGTSISFGDFTGNVTDMDGSEEIISVSITGVPDGFVIEGANNMGDGVWSLPNVISDDGQSFDLSDLSILPPNDFSGDIDLTLKVYTTDDNGDPVEKDVPVNIHVDAKADAVNTDVDASVSGDEDSANGITININAHAVDDENSVTDPASNVHEGAPEQVQVTISNVPDGATFGFPEGSDGEIIQNPDGTVTIISDGSDLDSIIFYPPEDGNSDNMTVGGEDWDGTLDLAIQGNDNGDTSGPVENVTVDIDIKAENDAAVNTAPDNVSASQDGSPTLIEGIQISDVDSGEGKGDYTVSFNAQGGTLALPEGTDTTGLNITDDGNGNYTIEGSIDDINAALSGGVVYTPNEGTEGDQTISMTTTDNGDADGNDKQTTISEITVNDVVSYDPEEVADSEVPPSSYNAVYTGQNNPQELRSHLASAAAQINTASVVPLTALLLGAEVVANEGETLELNHLGGAQVVDENNQPLGMASDDGSVTLTSDQVAEAYVQQQVESKHTEFTVVTKSADNRIVGEHNVSTASFNTTGLDSQRDVSSQNNSSASDNNAENVKAAAVGDAEHAIEAQNVSDLLAANPEIVEQLAENAEQLSDDLHAIVDEAIADKVSELQQDMNDASSQDLSLMDNPSDHVDDADELTSSEDSANYYEQSQQDDEIALTNEDAQDFDDANQDDGFFDEDDSFDWDHLAANGLDDELNDDASGMEIADDLMMIHSDTDFDVADLLDQDDQNDNFDMDKLLGDAAASSAADIGKPEEASADDLASTQPLDQPDVSGMGMDLSGLHDTSSAGHIINDLFDPNQIKPTDS